MIYSEFQKYMANYGFITTPITEEEYRKCEGYPINCVYGLACDVNAGLSFDDAFFLNCTSWEPSNPASVL